jgi:hypothetical protein
VLKRLKSVEASESLGFVGSREYFVDIDRLDGWKQLVREIS